MSGKTTKAKTTTKHRVSRIGVAAILIAAGAASASAGVRSERLALQFVGQGQGVAWSELSAEAKATVQSLSDASADFDVARLADFACFEIDLVDPSSGTVIGVGVDCLAPKIQSSSDPEGAGVIVEAYSFFMLPGGAFVSNGMTTVRPFFSGVGDAGRYTHVTGSVPGADNIVAGTGQFDGTGSVRVSGAVDMSGFDAGTINFDCLWIAEVGLTR